MPTIQEEISRVKELIFGNKTKDNQINECDSCMDDHHKEHGDSYMAKRQLYTIATKAQSMHDRLEHGEKLEDWMESKIAQMADNIDSVVNSFNYDESKEEMVCEVCGEVHEGTCGGENTEEEIYDKLTKITSLEEEIMSGMQGGYPDDSDGDNSYDFVSKGALGSESELEDEGFTEPETNYSKIKKGFNFDSEGPTDSYMDPAADYGMELSYELGEQDSGTESGESDDGAGAGTASVGVWDSGIARGIANQLANTKWGDSYQPSRGKANPLW